MIKQEFGPQAVILSARDINKRKGVLGLLRSPGVEVTAATDTHHNRNGKAKPELRTGRKWTLQRNPSAGSKMQMKAGQSQTAEVRESRRVPASASPRPQRPQFQRKDKLIRFLNFYEELVGQGVEEALASDVVERLREYRSSEEISGDEAIKSHLKDVLCEQGVAEGSVRMDPETRRVLVLIGPTGVGKTTTMAKVAATEAFQKGKTIALVTLNDHRIGATAQMEAYGKILGVPVAAVSDHRELKACLKRFRDKDLILVDTPGISHNDIHGIHELKGLLEAIHALEVHLLISAGTREKDFDRIFRKVNLLPIHRLLFTKIDETDEYGSMLNIAARTKLPLSYFSNGQQIPENLEKGTIERLVELLWSGRRNSSFKSRTQAETKPMDALQGRENVLAQEVYVANRNSDLFHHPSCKWIERIDERNMLIFKTHSEALANNFHPCRACHPVSGESRAPFTARAGEKIEMAGV